MLGKFKSFYISHAFRPGLLGILINPFYCARSGLFENISAIAHHIHGRLLDVGCGQKPYRDLFTVSEYVGLELDTHENRCSKKAEYFYDGHQFPFDDASFNSVIANQVLEHVFNPDEFLSEINRVLAPGGHLLLTVPFVWDEHEQPFDYARYSSFGLTYLLQKNNFAVIEHRKSVKDIRIHFQMVNCYFYQLVANWNVYFRVIALILLTTPSNILGTILYRFFPYNQCFYLDNVIIAEKELSHE